jgi:hypothetical protein
MKVESMDVVTLTATEMKDAIVERVERQTGWKIGQASLELVWDSAASASVKVDGTQAVRGVKVSGILIRNQKPAPGPELKCAE